MTINRRERKAVSNRNYAQAQYFKIQQLRRQVMREIATQVGFVKPSRAIVYRWLASFGEAIDDYNAADLAAMWYQDMLETI